MTINRAFVVVCVGSSNGDGAVDIDAQTSFNSSLFCAQTDFNSSFDNVSNCLRAFSRGDCVMVRLNYGTKYGKPLYSFQIFYELFLLSLEIIIRGATFIRIIVTNTNHL